MKTRDEIVDALDKRIRQIDCCVSILENSNDIMFVDSHSVYRGVKEELETLLTWIRD